MRDTRLNNVLPPAFARKLPTALACCRGFTLVELMVVLAVSVIILATAAPSLRAFLLNNQRSATVNELSTAFNMARSEALKRAQSVAVCTVANADAAAPTCAASSDWSSGWVVFVDADNNNAIDAGDEILRRYGGTPDGAAINGSRNTGQIEFDRLGAAQGSFATFAYCDHRGASEGRDIVVSNQGRIRTSTTANCAP